MPYRRGLPAEARSSDVPHYRGARTIATLAHAGHLMRLGRYAEAAKALRLVLARDPQDPQALAMMAIACAELEQWQAALEHAELAVRLAPESLMAWHAKGHVHLEMRQWPEAEAAAREAIRLGPMETAGHALLASTLAGQRRWPETLAAAEEGLRIDPTDDDCTNLRGFALTQLGDSERAAHALRGQLGRTPNDARTHANRGYTLLHTGAYREAQEHFREALRLDPQNEWAREGLVESLRAGHWFYRPILRFLLWMQRLTPRTQFGVLIGGYLLYRVVASDAVGGWIGGWKWLFLIPYLGFCLGTWFAPSLMNLVLLLSPLGRAAVSRREKVESVVVIGLLAAGVTGIGLFVAGAGDRAGFVGFLVGVVAAGMAFAFRQLFDVPLAVPRARRGMVFFTAACLACGLVWAGLQYTAFGDKLQLPSHRLSPDDERLMAALRTLMLVYAILCVWVSQFVAVWLVHRYARIEARDRR